MSDEEVKKTEVPAYNLKFDHPIERNIMYLEIPLTEIAKDQTMNSIIFLLGFFEQAKNEAVAVVQHKRFKAKQNGIISPIVKSPSDLKIV